MVEGSSSRVKPALMASFSARNAPYKHAAHCGR